MVAHPDMRQQQVGSGTTAMDFLHGSTAAAMREAPALLKARPSPAPAPDACSEKAVVQQGGVQHLT